MELYFRAWHTKNKEYLYIDGRRDLTLKDIQSINLDEYEIEPCSFVKDMNDDFIYDGDIILDTTSKKYLSKYTDPHPIELYYLCIFYLTTDYCNGFVMRSFHKYPFSEPAFISYVSQHFKIVGNIHETPNLLNDIADNPTFLDYIDKIYTRN